MDDRLAGIQYLNAKNATPAVSFAYDKYFLRRVSMTDGNGTTTYTYGAVSALGALKLASEAPPFANSTIAYAYDALGRVVSRTVGGDVETVAYDKLGRVTTHTDALGTFARTYLGQTGQLTSQSSGLVGTRWSYDSNQNDRRLTQILNLPLGTAFTYKTTPENDIVSMTETDGPQTWTYTYDLADRLLTASSSTGAAYKYGYDAAGNLGSIQRPSGTTTVVSNVNNQIATAGGTSYSYDANGNLLSDGTRTYQWDADNRLITIGYPGRAGSSSAFAYDGLGRRIGITTTTGGVSTQLHYGWCDETLCQARAANDIVTRRYFGEGEKNSIDGAMLYYGVDHLASVHDVISIPTGLRTNLYDYEPYGSLTQNTGTKTESADFRYAGLFFHQQSGLYLGAFRTYDSVMGRWTSRDPIGERGDVNIYAYAQEQPVGGLDPFGLLTVHIWNYQGSASAWGHASITLDDGTYISWWPSGRNRDGLLYNYLGLPIYSAPSRFPDYSTDVAPLEKGGEGHAPDRDIVIKGLDEAAIEKWWNSFQQSHQWSTFSQNCSTTAAEALAAGGGDPYALLGGQYLHTSFGLLITSRTMRMPLILDLIGGT